MQADGRFLLPVTDAFLHDSAHVTGIDGEKLARHRHLRELGFDDVADAVQRPAERVGDHRDRLGEADVLDAAVVHALLKLLGREARANLLLKRQPAVARVLDAVHRDAVHPLAGRHQRDRQRVHHEARVDAGAEHGHLGLLRPGVYLTRLTDVRVARVGQFLGRRDDRHPGFEHCLDLRHHQLHRRAGAEDHDVRLQLLQRRRGIAPDLHADAVRQPDDVAKVAAGFGGIGVDPADDLEALPRGDIPRHGGADRTQPVVHDADARHTREL